MLKRALAALVRWMLPTAPEPAFEQHHNPDHPRRARKAQGLSARQQKRLRRNLNKGRIANAISHTRI